MARRKWKLAAIGPHSVTSQAPFPAGAGLNVRDLFRGILAIFALPASTDAGVRSWSAVLEMDAERLFALRMPVVDRKATPSTSCGPMLRILLRTAPKADQAACPMGKHFTVIARTRSAATTGACICSPEYGTTSNTCAR